MEEKCINCGISNVPLYLELDGHLHCVDCIGFLLPTNEKEDKENVSENHKSGTGKCQANQSR